MQKNLRRLPRNLWVLAARSLFNDTSLEMLLNFIPFCFASAWGWVLGVRVADRIGMQSKVIELIYSCRAG